MDQLLEIKSVPIEIEMKISSAKLEYTRTSADLEISRDRGGLNIKSRPIRLDMDTFEPRERPARSVDRQARKGLHASYEATAAYARQGELLLKARIGEGLQRAGTVPGPELSARTEPASQPSAPPEGSRDEGELNIRFEMDKLNFDWRIRSGEFRFTPGDIEISVKQQPEVIIKYIGGPLYVPPSSDPDHEPVDVKA